MLLTLNPTARYVLGCELQSAKLVIGLFDLVGNLVGRVQRPKWPHTSPTEVVAHIAEGVTELLATADVSIDKVEGMGVAAPGPLDSGTGVLLTPPNMLGWQHVPLRRLLEEATGLPVMLEKDGNAAAAGEIWFGAGLVVRNLILIIVDDGVGAGIVIDGRLYRGAGGAGEIGHGTLDLDGPRCSCGNHGCLEALASGFALGRKAAEMIRRGVASELANHLETGIGTEHILKAAEAGDKLALDLLDECGRMLGIAVANTVNMYNPELIVLAGRLAQRSPIVLERALQLGRARAFPVLSNQVRIVRSALGDDFLLQGAAALILARLFRGPVNLFPS